MADPQRGRGRAAALLNLQTRLATTSEGNVGRGRGRGRGAFLSSLVSSSTAAAGDGVGQSALHAAAAPKESSSPDGASGPSSPAGVIGPSPLTQVVGRGRGYLQSLVVGRAKKTSDGAASSVHSSEFETSSRIDEKDYNKVVIPPPNKTLETELRGLKVSSPSPPTTTPSMPSPIVSVPKEFSQLTPEGAATSSPSTGLMLRQPTLYRGSAGKSIRVTSNYLRLEIDESEGCGVFEHEVIFEPGVDARDYRFRLLNQQIETIGRVRVFDGSKLYLPFMIGDGRKNLPGVHPTSGVGVNVAIVFKRKRNPNDRDIIYLYNYLFNKIMRILKLVQHKRNFFDPGSAHPVKAYNLEVWPGYVTAVDQFEGGLLLQCDVIHRVLRTETVKDALKSIYSKFGSANMKTEAEKLLLGASVLTKYNNKTYIVDDLDFESCPKSTFVNDQGRNVTYLEYYTNNYGIKIVDEDQPLLVHRPRRKDVHEVEGGVQKVICLIPELCLMTGLTDAMRADFKLMKEVGSFTRVTPEQRQQSLHTFVRNVNANAETKACLSDWGLKLAVTTLALEGRQLQPEVLYFGRNFKEVVTPMADWTRTATSKSVLTSVSLTKWAIVFQKRDEQVVRNFCQVLAQQGVKMGIQVKTPKVVSLANDRTETYLTAVRDIIDPSVQLVVTIFPQMRSDRYSAVKKLCFVEKPVASQVINTRTISNERRLTAIVQKIALQINCKLGGEPWGCTTPHKDLMVVGIDVYHDATRKGSSVAGVVMSINDSLSRYYSCSIIQREGQELLDGLKNAFVDGLIKYWEANGKWPRQIVVFRDGVGDGQLEVAEKHEAEQFIRAFRLVDGNGNERLAELLPKKYIPGFTFVVVQKRINTRIYSVVPKGQQVGYENPPSGTVLDHTVTRYRYKDFFLVSQRANQGTVSPTHYIVLRELGDEPAAKTNSGTPIPRMTASDVQKLAYKLTHMYFNWSGTVRVPAPVQYAHKLVDMVGQYVHKAPNPVLNDKLFYL